MYRVRRQISVSCKLLLQVGTWGLIYKISYDNLTIMLKLRSTYDGRLIYKTSHARLFSGTIRLENRKIVLREHS